MTLSINPTPPLPQQQPQQQPHQQPQQQSQQQPRHPGVGQLRPGSSGPSFPVNRPPVHVEPLPMPRLQAFAPSPSSMTSSPAQGNTFSTATRKQVLPISCKLLSRFSYLNLQSSFCSSSLGSQLQIISSLKPLANLEEAKLMAAALQGFPGFSMVFQGPVLLNFTDFFFFWKRRKNY